MEPWLKRHPTLGLFGEAGFDVEPLRRAVDVPEYRPFVSVDVALIESFLADLEGLLGHEAVLLALRGTQFVEDADVLLFSIIEAIPVIALDAAQASVAPQPVLRTLVAGVAENPDGAAPIARALLLHGVSRRAATAIFNQAHSRVHGWRLYFVARQLLDVEEARLGDIVESVAREEPMVFAGPAQVTQTVRTSIADGTLLVERAGRMPDAILRGAWTSALPMPDLIHKARARVNDHRRVIGSDRVDELGGDLWQCGK